MDHQTLSMFFSIFFLGLVYLFSLIIASCVLILHIVGIFKFYRKMGRSGILSLIPIINNYVLIRIAGHSRRKSIVYLLLSLIPILNFYIMYRFICVPIARKFNKSNTFAFILLTISQIGFTYLGFENDEQPIENQYM